MEIELPDRPDAVDLTTTPIHLGLGATAAPVRGFAWTAEAIAAYTEATAADGADGRLVVAGESTEAWGTWERHPVGDEVVICLRGAMTLLQEIDADVVGVDLTPGHAAINPRGVWHTADVAEPSLYLTITPGQGTEHRPR